MTVVGTPAVCPKSAAGTGDDCVDTDTTVNPDATEICDDNIDNDCNNKKDLADSAVCPTIGVNIWEPIAITHGQKQSVSAQIDPGPLSYSRVWSVVSASPAATCNVADLALTNQTDSVDSSAIDVEVPSDPLKKNCIWILKIVVNGYASDETEVRVRHNPPALTVDNASFDGAAWRLTIPAGAIDYKITGRVQDMDFESVSLTWGGTDVGLLTCSPSCSATVTMPGSHVVTLGGAAAPPGYQLTLTADDSYDSPVTVTIIIDVDQCLWVTAGGGNPPKDGSTPAKAMDSIQTALDQARNAANTSVCVTGTGTFTEDLTLPATPNTPNLLGGFSATGAPANNRPVVEVNRNAGILFEAGHSGMVRSMSFRQTAGFATAGGAAVITILDASPRLHDSNVTVRTGTPPRAIEIRDTGVLLAGTRPLVSGCTVGGSGAQTDATSVEVSRATGGSVLATIRDTNINVTSPCTGICRGIHARPGTNLSVQGSSVYLFGEGDVTGIDLDGDTSASVSGVITGSAVAASTMNGDHAFSIRMDHAMRVSISDNERIGMFSSTGKRVGIGIADVELVGGAWEPGNSTLVTISGNNSVGGGTLWGGPTCDAPDATVGVLLYGTSTVFIEDNGRPNEMMSGIFGGGNIVHWDPVLRRRPPMSAGVVLLDTSGVLMRRNEIRAGTMRQDPTCLAPTIMPPVIAWQDGLPQNPLFGGIGLPADLASRGTVVDQNGLSCAVPPENGAMGQSVVTWCTVIELNDPAGADAPLIANNHVAATKGNVLSALRQRGGSGVIAIYNTFDADLMLKDWEPPPPPNTIYKYGLMLEDLDPDGIFLMDNIIYVHKDDPYDVVTERFAIREIATVFTESNMGTLRDNLMFVQGDDPTVPGQVYVRVADGAAFQDYTSDKINIVAGVTAIGGNFVALPGLSEPDEDWEKSNARLLPGSAAINAATEPTVGAAVRSHDFHGDKRPDSDSNLPDIGHDEL